MDKERYEKYVEIAKRAKNEGLYNGERINLLMVKVQIRNFI